MRTELLHILQHSLGLDKHGRNQYPGYQRNHFCAGGRDRDLCRELAGMGYMEERRSSELTGGDPLFIVTDAGKEAIRRESPPPPKLTRGQIRYREFLRADCGLSFIEYLKARAGEDA